MAVEARFKVIERLEREHAEGESNVRITMEAAYNDGVGNTDWSKYTPVGDITMQVSNPEAAGYFTPGTIYRVVFSKMRE